MFQRHKIAMIVAEFLGTGILTAVVLSIAGSSLPYTYFIALAAGLAVAVGTLVLGPASGAHFNPLVTIGLWTARRIKTLPAIVYVGAQLLGGLTAYLLYTYLVNNDLKQSPEYDPRILVAEATGAFVFAMGWAATVYNRLEGGKAAFAVGASLVVGILVASVASSGIINPAVALGTQNWAWGTYVLGPILGGIIGFNLYALLFAPARELTKESKAKR